MPVDEKLNDARRKYDQVWREKNKVRRNAYRNALRKEHPAVVKIQAIDFYIRHAIERSENF